MVYLGSEMVYPESRILNQGSERVYTDQESGIVYIRKYSCPLTFRGIFMVCLFLQIFGIFKNPNKQAYKLFSHVVVFL